MSKSTILVFPDPAALGLYAAHDLRECARAAIAARGVFTLVLTGGDSPLPLYRELSTNPVFADFPWAQTQCFLGDERAVPPDNPESNYRQARETLLETNLIPEKNIHRIKGEYAHPQDAADEYERELREFFAQPEQLLGGFPRFDVLLGGIGPDGHTSSLFAGSAGMHEKQRWVIANWVEGLDAFRITLTFPVLNAARLNLLEAVDPMLCDRIYEVLDANRHDELFPVQQIKPAGDGELVWLLTDAVAKRLSPSLITQRL